MGAPLQRCAAEVERPMFVVEPRLRAALGAFRCNPTSSARAAGTRACGGYKSKSSASSSSRGIRVVGATRLQPPFRNRKRHCHYQDCARQRREHDPTGINRMGTLVRAMATSSLSAITRSAARHWVAVVTSTRDARERLVHYQPIALCLPSLRGKFHRVVLFFWLVDGTPARSCARQRTSTVWFPS